MRVTKTDIFCNQDVAEIPSQVCYFLSIPEFTLTIPTLIQFSLCSILANNLMSQISFHKSLATVMHRNFVWLK